LRAPRCASLETYFTSLGELGQVTGVRTKGSLYVFRRSKYPNGTFFEDLYVSRDSDGAPDLNGASGGVKGEKPTAFGTDF